MGSTTCIRGDNTPRTNNIMFTHGYFTHVSGVTMGARSITTSNLLRRGFAFVLPLQCTYHILFWADQSLSEPNLELTNRFEVGVL